MTQQAELRNWYFGINEDGLKTTFFQVVAAVRSCLANTPLVPHCVYVGRPNPRLRAIRKLGVKIIRHEPILKRELEIGYGGKYRKFAGHWLRVDLPVIATDEQYILYTDIDVLFRNWRPELLPAPALLAAAPETNINERHKFNSGVLVMNVPAMRAEMPAFHAAIKDRLLGNFVYPSHDQRSFNNFFSGRHDALDPRLNWKPYWGLDREASIVHFHGPKPGHVRMVRAGRFRGRPDLLATLARDPAAYSHYYEEWLRYAPPLPRVLTARPNRDSQLLLARMLADGKGVERDEVRAHAMLEALAASHFRGARSELWRLKLKSALSWLRPPLRPR